MMMSVTSFLAVAVPIFARLLVSDSATLVADAFTFVVVGPRRAATGISCTRPTTTTTAWALRAAAGDDQDADDKKTTETQKKKELAAPLVSGEELELLMTDWDTPLVVDAYATWYVRVYIHTYYT